MRRKWKMVFGLAVFNDVLDLVGIGAIPIIGDIIDLATSALFWKVLGRNYTLPTLLEFIPGVDLLPIYTATATYAYMRSEETEDIEEVKQDMESTMEEVDIR